MRSSSGEIFSIFYVQYHGISRQSQLYFFSNLGPFYFFSDHCACQIILGKTKYQGPFGMDRMSLDILDSTTWSCKHQALSMDQISYRPMFCKAAKSKSRCQSMRTDVERMSLQVLGWYKLLKHMQFPVVCTKVCLGLRMHVPTLISQMVILVP